MRQKGKGKETLFKQLREIDSCLPEDVVIGTDVPIVLNVEIRKSSDSGENDNIAWTMTAGDNAGRLYPALAAQSGTGMQSLEEAISKFQDIEINENFNGYNFNKHKYVWLKTSLLYFDRVSLTKDWEGKIHALCVELPIFGSPDYIYEYENGFLRIKTKEVVLNGDEYNVIAKTGLAFLTEEDGREKIYVFTEPALQDFAVFFGRRFIDVKDVSLGTAILAAQWLQRAVDFHLIVPHSAASDRIFMAAGISRHRYAVMPQTEIIKFLLDMMNGRGRHAFVGDWSVSEGKTEVDILLSDVSAVLNVIISGYQSAACFFRMCGAVGTARIDLDQTCRFSAEELRSGSADQFIDDALNAADQFSEKLSCLAAKAVIPDKSWYTSFEKIIGKKRFKNISIPDIFAADMPVNALQVYEEMAESVESAAAPAREVLSEKYERGLRKGYADLLSKLLKM